ncbi:MAG: DUF4359 domain-containing protein [Oscillatoriaceae bacterium SKW80]|nr:DUF4359 domain-containing protein [Oscillatoriaceae bacterium SKYG93]MCX8121866.1 DUF4359 domain-containing protein [Oscillatoriaceae bacterium SKW80]MDW8454627.1 DUF4359 domain-containing protein [Oscillatoriaceae cyanobacterium SKYGB_i_bin93]HIK27437.1 DUF4359 domain-containing protein [Oscillatoriaceae cyanobacterium M7585_C2015_266]
MKGFKIAILVTGVTLLGLGGAMVLTNPNQPAYDEYATDKLSEYIKEKVCQKAAILRDGCISMVDAGRADIQQVISTSTQRQNFIFFSIYKTELSLSRFLPPRLSSLLPGLPSYQFETLGVFQSFYIYKAKQN